MPLSPEEVRILGCLVEKQLTTPDSYPLTQNALVAACNQISNRHPVVSYSDDLVRTTLTELRARQLARIIHVPGGRVPKHRHVLDEALELDQPEIAVLAVLALRGPQTVGELRTRTERMYEFASLSEVEETLERLAARPEPLVVRFERLPGQKESRYAHLLSGEMSTDEMAAATMAAPALAPARGGNTSSSAAAEQIAALEARVAELEAGLAEVRRELGLE